MKRSMPWYMYPVLSCRVLHKIAGKIISNEGCKDVIDNCTMMLCRKQESYTKAHY